MTVKLTDIDAIYKLASKLDCLQSRRMAWEQVDLTIARVPGSINSSGRQNPDRHLPMLDDDTEMHSALVFAIIKEYDDRLAAIRHELTNMGVAVTSTQMEEKRQ